MLHQEYSMLDKMGQFETKMKELTAKLSKFSLIEFYHEETQIKGLINKLGAGLDEFSLYLPSSRLTIKDMELAQQTIKVELRERFHSFVEKVDHSFGLENYYYVCEHINDELIKDVYKKLGPFDHSVNQ
jgi:hypothetical protein